MKTIFILLCSTSLVLSSIAKKPDSTNSPKTQTEKKQKRTPAKNKKMQKRRMKLMGEILTKIDVSQPDQEKIRALQKKYRERMFKNRTHMEKARKKLALLQKQNASDAEIELAIQNITKVFGNQLRLLVKNRREMEKILGQTKYRQFMRLARKQFKNHPGRHDMMRQNPQNKPRRCKGCNSSEQPRHRRRNQN